MTTKQAKRIICDAKWKAVRVAAESPRLGAAMIREIEALEAELSLEGLETALVEFDADDCGISRMGPAELLLDEMLPRPSADEAMELNRIVARCELQPDPALEAMRALLAGELEFLPGAPIGSGKTSGGPL